MKRSLVASLALAVLMAGGSAGAADWTGLYAGLNLGAGINHSRYTLTPTGCFVTAALCGGPLALNSLRTDSAKLNDVAFVGGGQIGANYQMNSIVLGIETDFNYNGVDDKDSVNRPLASPLVGNFVHTVKQKFDYLGTVRGRLGFSPLGNALLYVTGGLAYGHIKSSTGVLFTSAGDTYVGSSSGTRAGWTLGAGGEYAFAGNWSYKVEYLFVDLGKRSYNDACVSPALLCAGFTPSPSYRTELKTREHLIRLGLNYKFFGA